MGLDMYLTARRALFRSSSLTSKEAGDVLDVFPEVDQSKIDIYSDVKVEFQVGYWRKANAIHQYFLEHVHGGEDDCEPIYASREHLQALRERCQKVLSGTPNVDGPKLLPTMSGFFFGSTEYDENYANDLRHTIEVIDFALTLPDAWDFYYRASW